MHEVERVALRAALLAAVVVAGLSLSSVPHVELVTLVVFASGIALGARGGAYIGLLGMPLYVFANSAFKGFPLSPLPILLAQAAGMSLAGLAGGAWRRFGIGPDGPRRAGLVALPVVGFVLAALYQAVTNGVFATLLAEGDAPRLAVFWSGMAFGLIDMVWNAVVFGVGGPLVVEAMRETAARRGWWRVSAALLATLVMAGDAAAAPADSLSREPRSLVLAPEPLWSEFSAEDAALRGVPSFASFDAVAAGEALRTTSRGVRPNLDRWGLGWDRVAFSYAGLPLRGPVHGFAEPPDVPIVWSGSWKERWTASGTRIDFSEPPSPGRKTRSQISLTSGTRSKRSAEFALTRNLGPVDLAVDFEDRFEQGWSLFDELDRTRVWLHLGSAPGKRPDWMLDLSGASDEKRLLDGSELKQDARRLQGSLRGPFLAGGTRLAFQLRRQALSYRSPVAGAGFDEVRMDGVTAGADWAAPVSGLVARARWDLDRRRGILEERAFQGIRAGASWSLAASPWSFGIDGEAGHQEPYGATWEATASASLGGESGSLRLAVSHEEDLPPLVVGADRPAPQEGMDRYLRLYEEADRPERRSAVRLEGTRSLSFLRITAGFWTAAVRGYRIESNPLWITPGTFAPADAPETDAVVAGSYGEARLDFGHGVYGTGRGRIHGRDPAEVPYLARWLADGSLHWRRTWFGTLDLDAAVGGLLVGPRKNPALEEYPVDAFGYLLVTGRIGTGAVTFRVENLADSFAGSDLRFDDGVSLVSVAGRTISVGLTLLLED